jgi:two-component system, response regulator RegA
MLKAPSGCQASCRIEGSRLEAAADEAVVVDSLPRQDLFLIEASTGSRAVLQRTLTAQGFNVTGVAGAQQAQSAMERQFFDYAVVALGLRGGKLLDLVRQLRRCWAALRIAIVTDVDSVASAIVVLRAGADDYMPKSAHPAELTDASLNRSPELPPVPIMPLGLSRVCWEHILRIHEQCGRNVSATAQRLGTHRRSLQRILNKRAPQPRADQLMSGPAQAPLHNLRRQRAGRRRGVIRARNVQMPDCQSKTVIAAPAGAT